MNIDRLLHQRGHAAVLAGHHDARAIGEAAGNVVGHVEGSRIDGHRASVATCTTGCTVAHTADTTFAHATGTTLAALGTDGTRRPLGRATRRATVGGHGRRSAIGGRAIAGRTAGAAGTTVVDGLAACAAGCCAGRRRCGGGAGIGTTSRSGCTRGHGTAGGRGGAGRRTAGTRCGTARCTGRAGSRRAGRCAGSRRGRASLAVAAGRIAAGAGIAGGRTGLAGCGRAARCRSGSGSRLLGTRLKHTGSTHRPIECSCTTGRCRVGHPGKSGTGFLHRHGRTAHGTVTGCGEAIRGEVVRDRTGHIIGIRGTVQDISRRKSAEEALQRSQERFRALVRASSDAVYSANADWSGFRWVDGKELLTESDDKGEWLKKNVIAQDRAKVRAEIGTAAASKRMFEVEYRAIRPDQSIGWMHTRAVPILSPTGDIEEWFGMISDISSIKMAELALTASEAKYRAAIETTADGFLILDEAGRVLEANDSYVRQSGYGNEELRSLAFADLCSCDTREEIDTILDTVRNSGRERFLIWLRNKTGSTLPAEINISFKHDEPGGRFYLFMQNVEEKMRLEKESQEQRSAMDALVKRQVASQTVAAIAHELNQPLVAASAYGEVALEMARAHEPPIEELATILERNIEQVHRAGASLHQLVAFLHKTEVEFSPLDINTTITKAVAIVRENGTTPFKTVLKLAPNLPKVRGNELQIQKVIINLIQNGIEAMHDAGAASGAISVRVRTGPAGQMVQVTVSDTGPGLDTQNAQQIFEPFFSTKSGGLGLGLAVSRAVVEAHGGQLWIDPKPGPGATFHFTLPYADE